MIKLFSFAFMVGMSCSLLAQTPMANPPEIPVQNAGKEASQPPLVALVKEPGFELYISRSIFTNRLSYVPVLVGKVDESVSPKFYECVEAHLQDLKKLKALGKERPLQIQSIFADTNINLEKMPIQAPFFDIEGNKLVVVNYYSSSGNNHGRCDLMTADNILNGYKNRNSPQKIQAHQKVLDKAKELAKELQGSL